MAVLHIMHILYKWMSTTSSDLIDSSQQSEATVHVRKQILLYIFYEVWMFPHTVTNTQP